LSIKSISQKAPEALKMAAAENKDDSDEKQPTPPYQDPP
jgi:hypothetical protein